LRGLIDKGSEKHTVNLGGGDIVPGGTKCSCRVKWKRVKKQRKMETMCSPGIPGNPKDLSLKNAGK
jgi:hypothetical protein